MPEPRPLPLAALVGPVALDFVATGAVVAGVLLLQRPGMSALGGCLIGLGVVGFVASAAWVITVLRAHQRDASS